MMRIVVMFLIATTLMAVTQAASTGVPQKNLVTCPGGFSWVPDEVKMVRGEKVNVYVKVNCDPDDVVVKAEFEGMGVKIEEDNLVFTKYNESNGVGWVYATLYPFYDESTNSLVDTGDPDDLLIPGVYTLTLHMYSAVTGEEISEAETTIPVTVVPLEIYVDVPSEVKKGEPIVVKIYTNRDEEGYDYIYVVLDLGVKKMKYSKIALDENGNAEVVIPTAEISPGTYTLYVRDAMRTVKGDVEDWYDIPPTDAFAKYYNAQDDVLFIKIIEIVEATNVASVTIYPSPSIVPLDSTTTINVLIDAVPSTGLSYVNLSVSITDPSVAEITDIEFPSWTTLTDHSTLPASTVWFKVGDLSDQVKAGDTNVVLVTLTIKGLAEGTSDITITVNSFQDDNYQNIEDQIATISGTITVIVGPPSIDGAQPMDLNGDGLFEDVNGDASFNFGDVVFFFKNFDKPEIQNYPQFYDFNNDGSVNFGDVVALFKML